MVLETDKIYFVKTTSGSNWLFKYAQGVHKTQCSQCLCIDDMYSEDDCDWISFVCHDHEIVTLSEPNKNYIAMFNHVFEDEQG